MKLELALSIYASVVATFVFIWRMYTYMNDRKSKLYVSQRLMNRYNIHTEGVDFESEQKMLEITITNKGTSSRYIERPSLKLNKKSSSGNIFSLWTRENMNIDYPRIIQSGERLEFSFPFEGLKDVLNNGNGATKYRAFIKDTHGNTFESKWIRI